jgi:hypothetical protein
LEIAVNIITIGKRLISLDQIAYVEPFDPTANPEFKPEKDFKARLVLLNRDVVLTETAPKEFSEANGFHLLAEDNVAVNPSLAFKVETFAPTESFKPGKAYRTRIKWRMPTATSKASCWSRSLFGGGGRRAFPARRRSSGGCETHAAPAGPYAQAVPQRRIRSQPVASDIEVKDGGRSWGAGSRLGGETRLVLGHSLTINRSCRLTKAVASPSKRHHH